MKRILLPILLCVLLLVPTASSLANSEGSGLPLVVDAGDLLTADEEAALTVRLNKIASVRACEVIVVTVKTLGTKSSQAYADDYFDENGYGYGAYDSGVLLLVCLEERDWAVSTHQFGQYALTDAGLEQLEDAFRPDLTDGNYMQAFLDYAETCDWLLAQARDGKPYYGELSVLLLVIAVGVGLALAFIPVSVMKKRLNTVAPRDTANEYLKKGSLTVTQSQDLFLYKNLVTVHIPKSSGGGSGGGSHVSSSGSTHGGSSGKF